MAQLITAKGAIPIDPKELIDLASANRIAAELEATWPGNGYAVQEYVPAAATDPANSTTIQYDNDGKRIYQIMPGFQDAAELFYAQQGNYPGHWEGSPLTARWVSESRTVVASGPSADPNAVGNALDQAAGMGFNPNDRSLLYRIFAAVNGKVGA